MADTDWSDLARRAASGVLLAIIALAAAWWGGWLFVALWLVAAGIVLTEWLDMVLKRRPPAVMAIGLGAVAAAAIAAGFGQAGWGAAILVAGSVGVWAFVRGERDGIIVS